MYFDYPLKQGLRRDMVCIVVVPSMYFDYPLKQGLRPTRAAKIFFFICILIIH